MTEEEINRVKEKETVEEERQRERREGVNRYEETALGLDSWFYRSDQTPI